MTRGRRAFAKRVAAIGLAVLALLGIALAIGLREALSTPLERQAKLALPGWPKQAPPLRIALLSDIHIGNRTMGPDRLASIVADVNAAQPDLILIAGDFMAGGKGDGPADRATALSLPLSRLRARLGVIAVLGNHDYYTGPSEVRRALARAGVTVLVNEAARRGPVTVLGVDDAFSGHDDLRRTLAAARPLGGIPIVLTHAPDLVHQLGSGFPLVLAGHTHCGQVVLPWYGPVLTHAPLHHWKQLYDSRYRCGLIRGDGRSVVVTAGVGSGTALIRLGAPPDWWLLTIGGPA